MLKHILILVLGAVFASSQAWSEEATELKTDKERLSYSIGASIGKNLKKEGTDVDTDILIKAIKAGLAGKKLAMPDREIQQVLGAYQNELRQHAKMTRQQASIDNKKKGDAYLADNKAKKGVVELPTGVQYKILKEGKGKKPSEFDMVQVYYRGTLIDGTEFDSTDPNKPAKLKVSALIAGWKQVLTLMSVGSKWQIAIPSQLAYGDRGMGSDIGPNEVLLFDVELVGVE